MRRFSPRSPMPAAASILALAASLFLAGAGHSEAAQQKGDFGLGIVAGEPSGISGKLWLGPNNALDFIAGFSIQENRISVNADYVWQEWDLIPVRQGKLPLYYGMGLWTNVANSPSFGARGVVGLEYLFPSAPLDVFLELGPGVAILPSTDVNLSAGLGMRFFF